MTPVTSQSDSKTTTHVPSHDPMIECPYEADVVSLVLGRRWPAQAEASLQQHVHTCAVCGDVVTIADLLQGERETARYDVQVPAAGQVWWRAAVRARLEASHRAARPFAWLHGLAAACAVGVFAAVMSAAWPLIHRVLDGVRNWIDRVEPGAASVIGSFVPTAQWGLAILAIVVLCAVVAPVALYVALADD